MQSPFLRVAAGRVNPPPPSPDRRGFHVVLDEAEGVLELVGEHRHQPQSLRVAGGGVPGAAGGCCERRATRTAHRMSRTVETGTVTVPGTAARTAPPRHFVAGRLTGGKRE